MILEEKIAENSSDEDVRQAIALYLRSKQFDSMNVAITLGSEFQKAIENAVDLKQDRVAIVLTEICLEQMTNEF